MGRRAIPTAGFRAVFEPPIITLRENIYKGVLELLAENNGGTHPVWKPKIQKFLNCPEGDVQNGKNLKKLTIQGVWPNAIL